VDDLALDPEAIRHDGFEIVRAHVDGDQGMARRTSRTPRPGGVQRHEVHVDRREAPEERPAEVAQLGWETAVEEEITVSLLEHAPLWSVKEVANRVTGPDQMPRLRIAPGCLRRNPLRHRGCLAGFFAPFLHPVRCAYMPLAMACAVRCASAMQVSMGFTDGL